MTDKEIKAKTLAEIERLKTNEYFYTHDEYDGFVRNALDKVSNFINSLPEEPVSKVYTFKAIPRLLEMIQPSDRAKFYATKLAERLESEGYPFDATIVKESIKVMNGEKVAMATMDEEPVSEELEEASRNYADGEEYGDDVYFAIKAAFKAGAQWQKSHIWHSPDEKPEEDKDILFLRSEAFIHNSMCYTDCNFCNDAMRGCDKWCYIADLED